MKQTFTIALSCVLLCGSPLRTMAQKIDFTKFYGSSGPATEGQGIRQLADGNLLLVATQSTQAGAAFQADVLVIKMKPDGTPIWTKQLGSTTMREYAQAMDVLPSGNIIIGGHITDLAETRHDGLLLCLDPAGTVLWQKTYGHSGAHHFFNSVKVLNDGFVVSGAYSTTANGDGDAMLMRMNTTGDSLWTKTYGGPEYDDSWDMELAPDGGFVLTGGNYSFAQGQFDDAWVIKTDALGNEQWKKMYGLADRVDWSWAINTVKTNGTVTGYVITGVKNTEEDPPGLYYGDIHFVKIDLQGNVVWDKSISTPTGNMRREGMDIAQLGDGGFVIAGAATNGSVRDVYVVKTNASGDVLWTGNVTGTGEIYLPRAVATTSDGGCVITGAMETSTPSQEVFVTKVGGLTTGINNVAGSTIPVQVYPNPTTGSFTIQGSTSAGEVNLSLTNAAGQVVYTATAPAKAGKVQQQVLLGSTLPNGLYLLHMGNGATPVKITLQR